MAADDQEHVGHDDAVAVIDRRLLPEFLQHIETVPRRGLGHPPIAALDTNDAIEVDGPHWMALLAEELQVLFRGRSLQHAHAIGRASDAHRLDRHAHRPCGDRLGLVLAHFAGPRLRPHLRGAHGGGTHPLGVGIDLDGDFDVLRRGPQPDDGVEGLALDRLQVFRLRVGNHALDDLAHQRQRHTDRRDDLGVLGDRVRELHAFGGKGDQRGGTATLAHQHRLVTVEPVLGDELLDHGDGLVGGALEDPAGRVLDRTSQHLGQRRHGEAGGLRIAVGVQAGLGVAQHVGGTGVGDRIARPVGDADRHVIVGIVTLGLEQLDTRAGEDRRLGEGRVGKPGDVGAARPDVDQLAVSDTHHAAAGDADNAHIEGTHVGLVAADAGVLHGRPAVADDADVCAGAADLEVDAVRHPEMHERAGDAGGWTGQHRHRRAASHLVDVHDAAVAAHDHERCLDAGLAHARLGHVRRVDHLGQDAGVDHRRAGARRESVELRDLVAAGHGHFRTDGGLADRLLAAVIVDAEGAGRDDDAHALRAQLLDGRQRTLVGELFGGDETVTRPQEAPGRQLDLADVALPAREQRFHAARHADHADRRHVAFQQRVRGLGGAVRQEDHMLGIDPGAIEDVAEHLHHALGHAALVGMGGQHRIAADHLVCRIVDQHRLGEGAADVDADAKGPVVHAA